MSALMPVQTIRRMKVDDLAGVLFNERRSYSHPWTESVLRDVIDSDYECWVFFLGKTNIGHGILSFGAGESHLLNVCINPEQQGQGYGTKLVEHLLAQAREQNAQKTFLEVRASNLAAYALYLKLGFNDIGVRHDYYPAFSGREDALVLMKELYSS